MDDPEREARLEKLIEKYLDFESHHTKANILILFGRYDKVVGKKNPPQIQITEFGV